MYPREDRNIEGRKQKWEEEGVTDRVCNHPLLERIGVPSQLTCLRCPATVQPISKRGRKIFLFRFVVKIKMCLPNMNMKLLDFGFLAMFWLCKLVTLLLTLRQDCRMHLSPKRVSPLTEQIIIIVCLGYQFLLRYWLQSEPISNSRNSRRSSLTRSIDYYKLWSVRACISTTRRRTALVVQLIALWFLFCWSVPYILALLLHIGSFLLEFFFRFLAESTLLSSFRLENPYLSRNVHDQELHLAPCPHQSICECPIKPCQLYKAIEQYMYHGSLIDWGLISRLLLIVGS